MRRTYTRDDKHVSLGVEVEPAAAAAPVGNEPADAIDALERRRTTTKEKRASFGRSAADLGVPFANLQWWSKAKLDAEGLHAQEKRASSTRQKSCTRPNRSRRRFSVKWRRNGSARPLVFDFAPKRKHIDHSGVAKIQLTQNPPAPNVGSHPGYHRRPKPMRDLGDNQRYTGCERAFGDIGGRCTGEYRYLTRLPDTLAHFFDKLSVALQTNTHSL